MDDPTSDPRQFTEVEIDPEHTRREPSPQVVEYVPKTELDEARAELKQVRRENRILVEQIDRVLMARAARA